MICPTEGCGRSAISLILDLCFVTPTGNIIKVQTAGSATSFAISGRSKRSTISMKAGTNVGSADCLGTGLSQ